MTLPQFDVDTVLAELTLEEKASLLSGLDDWFTQPIDRPGLSRAVPPIEVGDGPHGLRKETGVDMVWVPATGFPTASAMGASWDRDLTRRVGAAIGEEARAEGVQVVLGPGVNMKRSPLCGRNFEYFSEDPMHSGELGAAYVQGVQSTGVGTSLKHFAANNQEIERTRISVVVDDRTLRETYLAAFERVVRKADPWTVMCSYNRLRGVHASENRWLLTEILRDEWGFRGAVVSDWNAVHDRVAAVRAGLDLEMPGTEGRTDAEIVAAVRAGELDEAIVDNAARRVLRLVARAYPGADLVDGPVMSLGHSAGDRLTTAQLELLRADEHHALAREAAAACITLLRNEPAPHGRAVLPLSEAGTGTIAVVGAFAEHARIQGGGSSGVDPTRVDAPLEAIRAIAGERVIYSPGYVHLPKNPYQDDNIATLAAHEIAFVEGRPTVARRSATLARELQLAEAVQHAVNGPLSPTAERLIDEAVAAAEDAETIVVFAGLPLAFEQEANDRATLALPGDHVALISRLADLRERTGATLVVVLSNGTAVTMDPWHDRVDAIVESWLTGQALGGAVADVLFGRVNPSGKISETFPTAVEDTPGQPNWLGERGTVLYGEGVFIGYRWYDALGRTVRYPFGHGLSYTSFAYSDLSVEVTDAAAARVRVSVTIANEGPVAGAEIVQLYIGDPDAEVYRPVRELRGFEKVRLEAGQSVRVEFALESRDFAYWDAAAARGDGRLGLWRREGGDFRIEVGASSRDIRVSDTIQLPDDPTIPALIRDADLQGSSSSRFVQGHAG
ncbi:glycoside hydrolase family 3 C-terminal domain-containing protein [Microbacterium trichothecenolyticum]|uniref:Glycoside hydrolase family 3 C-terminal domain-containing protein n=1 Tax=Microbacterium ureisolvens TaxID=2781186 RepID=A0ABS7I0R2_9MICO|nr:MULTISPECIES: glycoside hydrolase family 3 C-terminal domain-containing protein [Microbacterium]MBW9110416.1 glycoside hydrolase family 3 C-terminal domain-containing protein [Microbacterium ureisolvens]MBW9120521.1 glycoside hydrolase family 3 C-terminal domain-containing protein [Microbacterium trichothecenolyticum]